MAKLSKVIFGCSLIVIAYSCASVEATKNNWFRDVNVCKKLVEDVLVYPVFVQSKKGEKWNDALKKEYTDSLNVALKWIESKAVDNNVKLRFITEVHPKTIVKGLPEKTISETNKMLSSSGDFTKFNKHYDGVSKMVSSSVTKAQENKPLVTKIKNKERLVAQLRNTYNVESVVLMFVHLPEGLDNIYLTMNSLTNKDVEFNITTFKSPNVLAYQVLEIFGAAPLMYSKNKKKEKESWEYVQENFPMDVMANLGRSINTLEIGSFTQYLIGWKSDYKEEYKQLYSLRNMVVK